MRPFLLTCLIVALLPACATRTVSKTVINEQGLEIRLRSEKPTLGFKTLPRGYNQPIKISPARLQAILSGIQVDERPSRKSTLRERRFAISRKLLPKIADGLSRAYAEAGPNQEIVVLALEKRMHNFVFARKFLTSFVTWVEGEELIINLSRLGSEANERRAKDKMEPARYDLPTPVVGEIVMPFNTVADGPYEANGPQGIKVVWRDSAFGAEAIEQNVAGHRTQADHESTSPEDSEQKVPMNTNKVGPDEAAGTAAAAASTAAAGASTESPIVKSSATVSASEVTGAAAVAGGASTAAVASDPKKSQTDSLRGLSAQDLRQLADLEEARAKGQITAEEYEARRGALLEKTD